MWDISTRLFFLPLLLSRPEALIHGQGRNLDAWKLWASISSTKHSITTNSNIKFKAVELINIWENYSIKKKFPTNGFIPYQVY
jgi:hypothetical protein